MSGERVSGVLPVALRRVISAVVVAVTAVLLLHVSAGAARASVDQAFEDGLHAQLAAQVPAALEPWQRANAARDADQLDVAAAAYREVIELAPQFDAASRRLAMVLCRPDHCPAEALASAEVALALADTPFNQAAVGSVLLTPGSPRPDEARALALLASASDAAGGNPAIIAAVCHGYAVGGRHADLRACAHSWLGLDPEAAGANYLVAIFAGQDGRFGDARRHLARAKSGISADEYEQLRRAIDEADPAGAPREPLPAWVWSGAWLLGAWAAGLLLLFAVGWLLSFLTLRTIRRTATGATADGTTGERVLRSIYGAVVVATGAYFWISVPVVLAAVVGGGIAIIAAFWMIGYLPIKGLFLLVLVVGASVLAIARSVFVRGDDSDPGPALDLARHPRLRQVLDEVAAAVDTRAIDTVYLVPGVDVAVFERRRRDRSRRYLILGVGALDGMQVGWLKSILAHEYGHFRNQDTAGGTFALAARRSMFSLVLRLAQSGTAGWFNPAWWFARAYLAVFLRVSQGASRLQEVLADRWAALAYGSSTFAAAYQHVVERAVRFDAHTRRVLVDVVDREQPLANFYQHQAPSLDDEDSEDVDRAIAEALDRPPSPYDSHPAPRQRMTWVTALAAPATTSATDAEAAWSLFSSRDDLEGRMTEEIRDNIEAQIGRRVPSAEAAAQAAPDA